MFPIKNQLNIRGKSNAGDEGQNKSYKAHQDCRQFVLSTSGALTGMRIHANGDSSKRGPIMRHHQPKRGVFEIEDWAS